MFQSNNGKGNGKGNGNGNGNGKGNGNKRRELMCFFDPKWVNLIIGPRGETVKSIARNAGNGCSVWHHNDLRGNFTISSWDSNANCRAKLAIEALINKQLDKEKNEKKGYMNIHPRLCGFVIGKGGETVKGIAQKAGAGCRITFDSEAKGRIIITAHDADTIVRAKMEIQTLVETKDGKVAKPQEVSHVSSGKAQNPVKTSRYAALYESESEESEEDCEIKVDPLQEKRQAKRLANFKKRSAKQDKKASHLLGFNGGSNGIRALKEKGRLDRNDYKQWLETINNDWDQLSLEKKKAHGCWENYLYEKKGERFKAQEEKNNEEIEDKMPKSTTTQDPPSMDHSEWERLGDGPVRHPLDVWGLEEGLKAVRKYGRPLTTKITVPNTVEDKPTPKLNNLTRSPKMNLPHSPGSWCSMSDCWSDDEDEHQECNCKLCGSITQKLHQIPGVMNQDVSDMLGYDEDLSEWRSLSELENTEYA